MSYLLWAMLSAFVAAATIAAMLSSGRVGPIDRPNERSLHATPIPRSGGIGIMAGVVLGIVVARPEPSLVGGLALLALVSWLDDCRSLPILVRFASHFAAAFLALATMPDWGWPGLMTATLIIVWVTNLFNFMDGADGLAGGMAVFGFGTYAAAAVTTGEGSVGVLAAMLAAASMGFLVFNFPPAKIFMGDAGSIPLGFLAASLGMYGWATGVWPWTFPLLAFSPFLVDASLTLMRRGLRGERVWLAHREHYYQRLVRMGWSRRRLITAEYLLMAAAAGSAMALLSWPLLQWPLLAAWGALYFVLARWIDHKWESQNDV